MTNRELTMFARLAVIDVAVMVTVPTIWTIIFWNSPLLTINIILPIGIASVFMIPAIMFILWKAIS